MSATAESENNFFFIALFKGVHDWAPFFVYDFLAFGLGASHSLDMSNLILFIVSAICLMLSGCETGGGFTPAVVNGPVISNPTVGYDGYLFRKPSGYVHYDPIKYSGHNAYGDLLYQRQKHGVFVDCDLLEGFIFVEAKRGILFSVNEFISPYALSEIDYDKRQRLLGFVVSGFYGKKAMNKKHEVMLVRTHERKQKKDVGYAYYEYESDGAIFSRVKYVVLGELKEVFVIEGIAPKSGFEKMDRDIRTMINSLSF